MTRASEIITDAGIASGFIGIGETMSSDDAQVCLRLLNDLLDSMNTNSAYLWGYQDNVATTTGQAYITIGSGGDLNVTRPVEVGDVINQRINGVDYPLKKLTRNEYEVIALKSLTTPLASYWYYDEGFPLGKLFIYPVPAAGAELHIPLLTQITEFASLDADYTFPQGYRRELKATLAEEICSAFTVPITPAIANRARQARKWLKRANFKPTKMVTISNRARLFNIYTGQ